MPRDWDASTYERLSSPIAAMGREVLDRLELRGDEIVLDAGCGTGKRAGFAVAGREPFAAHLGDWPGDWNFASPASTEERLRRAGFGDVWCWLSEVRVDPEDPAGYLRAICLGSFLARLPEELHGPFVDGALAELHDPLRIDYVRLNILARRPTG